MAVPFPTAILRCFMLHGLRYLILILSSFWSSCVILTKSMMNGVRSKTAACSQSAAVQKLKEHNDTARRLIYQGLTLDEKGHQTPEGESLAIRHMRINSCFRTQGNRQCLPKRHERV